MAEFQNDELGRAHSGHADFDDKAAFEYVQFGHGLIQTYFNKKRLLRRRFLLSLTKAVSSVLCGKPPARRFNFA